MDKTKATNPIFPRKGRIAGVISHSARIALVFLLAIPSCFATAIMVMTDGKEVAVAADSKRSITTNEVKTVDPKPECKIRRINGGVFFAAGRTGDSFGPDQNTVTWSFDAYQTGMNSAIALQDPGEMIETFTKNITKALAMSVSISIQIKDPVVQKWKAGADILQAGYAIFLNGKPSFYVRSFFPVINSPRDIAFKYIDDCPSGCAGKSLYSVNTNYFPLGSQILISWVQADPNLATKTPLDFVSLLVGRAAKELPAVGPPLTSLTITGDNKVKWEQIGACVDEAKKEAVPPSELPAVNKK